MKGMIHLIKLKKMAALLTCIAMLAGLWTVPAAAAGGAATKVILNVSNDAGDYCYFDSNYCYTSANAKYNNLAANTGDNYMEFYRLDYTNPRRKGFMYAERTEKDTYCFFNITLDRSNMTKYPNKIYDHILINGDIMTTLLECEAQMFMIRSTADSAGAEMTLATLGADGRFTFSDGTVSDVLVKKGEWANYKIAINLETHTADIYFNGTKIKAGLTIPSEYDRIKQVRFRLMEGGIGNMYLDNLQVTGLIEPFVDGVETPTDIYPAEDDIRDFLEGKVAFHGYSGLVYKDGIKRLLSHEPLYDTENQELYVSEDEIKSAFGISSLSVSADGAVTADGTASQLSTSPISKDGVSYIPVTAFAEEVLGKYVFSFKTGFFIVGDVNEVVDTSTWKYQSFRSDSSQITLWNDIDFLNAFLQYERPDAARLKADFEAVNGYSHPRVLADKSDFDRLREAYANDTQYAQMAQRAIRSAKSVVSSTVLRYEYDDAMRMLSVARNAYNRFFYLGYAWQLTGDSKYVERAYEEVCALAEFPDFNTSHIIDAGEFAMALAVAYDWLYDGYTPEQREFVARVCVEQGLKPLASGMYGRLTSTSNGTNAYSSFRWRSNYNSIVVGGCLNAAVAAMEYDEDYCLAVVENCLKGYEYSIAEIMPGGGWNEAPSYWNYAFQYINVGLSTLNAAFGTDYCLSRSMGMEDTLKFAVACLGATGINNFHDSGSSGANSYSEFMYLSQLFNNKTAYDLRYNDIVTKGGSPGQGDLLYYNPDGLGDDARELDTVNYIRGVELFSVRDSFDTENDEFYFSTHFGTTSGYHQHNDCSTFVLDIMGQRWAEDLGSEDYNLQNELGYPEYSLYRKRAEGHNVMVINPADYAASMEQKTGLFVPVTEYAYNDTDAYVKADMSEVYTQADSMEMGYYIDRESQTVTMRNEFIPTNDNSQVYWFMHTKAEVNIDGNAAYLAIGDKSVKLEFDTNADSAELVSMAAQPLPTSPQVPEQKPNTGYTKVAIKLDASDYTTLTVKISPADNEDDMLLTPLENWHLLSESENDVVLFEASEAADFGSFVRGTLSDETGVGGKESYDKSVKVVMSEADGDTYSSYHDYIWGETDSRGYWSEADGDGYLIISANVFSTSGTGRFRMCTAQNAALGEELVPEANRWHNVAVIYDRATGMSKTVVDGVHGEYMDCGLGKSRSDSAQIRNAVRFLMIAKNQGDSMYIDDVNIYTSDTDYLPSIPALDGNYRIEGSRIQAMTGLTGDELASGNEYIVNVFDSQLYTSRISGELELSDGNVVVLSDDNNLYRTYFVTSDTIHVSPVYKVSQSSSFNSPSFICERGTSSAAYGIGGKATTDESMYYVGSSSTTTDDFYIQTSFTESEVAKDTALALDIYVSSVLSFNSALFATGGHAAISSSMTISKLSAGTWHNLVLIHRAATNDNELYIDGVLAGTLNRALSSNVIRFIFKPINKLLGGNNSTEVYLDNINYMYGEDIVVNPISSSAYTISGAYISGAAGSTVVAFKKNITKVSSLYDVHVYNTDGSLAADTAAIASGMYVYVTENGYVTRQYYIK